jgi:hypothetical protein
MKPGREPAQPVAGPAAMKTARAKPGSMPHVQTRIERVRESANRFAAAQPKTPARPGSQPPRPELLPAKMRGIAAQARPASTPRVARSAFLPERRSRALQRAEEVACMTCVVAPTRRSYPVKDASDVRTELVELEAMVSKDIQFLSSQQDHVCRDVLHTGAPDSTALTEELRAMSNSAPETIKEIVFTAHGSPGRNGKIGMGYDQEDKPDYRVNAAELVEILKSLGIEALLGHQLHFYFRCCNSAYANIDCQKKIAKDAKDAILDQSFIAGFHKLMEQLGCKHLKVTGFRGYYFPAVKKPELSTDDGKTKRPIAEGTVTIDEHKNVVISSDIWKLKSTQKLNDKL